MLSTYHTKNFQKILHKNTHRLRSIHKRALLSSIKCSPLKPHRNDKFQKRYHTAQSSENVNTTPTQTHNIIRRLDYLPPPFLVANIDLDFDIYDGHTIVTNSMLLKNNPNGHILNNCILLNGDKSIQIESISVNNHACDYIIHDNGSLEIPLKPHFYDSNHHIPITIQNRIKPESNTSLEGLYKSANIYCTQCEAEGFRKMTYFFDRPDITSLYTVTLRANKDKCPILLSNGNVIESGMDETDAKRHFVKWFDPFPKPSYLFAIVAGDLQWIEDTFTTFKSEKKVILRIYTESHNIDKCDWAMQSLKQAMKWDESKYGLEYDLDLFNIVAVDDFNMGAMENKSLNIFNTKYVLASNDTATDTDYHNVQRVIAHEYFHNYTGNRVTCRDWFQLSLKEGLTVFRDQQFSADYGDRGVERVDQVQMLQATQFKEDAGPMAHAVRPDEYIEINNFYTVTVYEKGAEIVRMIQTMIGRQNFKNGLNLYLSRFDGCACVIEDFVNCMSEVSGFDLSQMLTSWYSQPGTPEVSVNTFYDAKEQSFVIKLRQNNPNPKANNINTNPYLIPLQLSLLNRKMDENHSIPYELIMDETKKNGPILRTLLFGETESEYKFYNIESEPLLSINREFSAPVYIQHSVSMSDLSVLAIKDSDPFHRWSANHKLLSIALIKKYTKNESEKEKNELNPFIFDTFKRLLQRFVPETSKKEWKIEQDSNKRKQILRENRRRDKQTKIEHQFLMENDPIIQETDYAHFAAQDLNEEKFIEDLIGSTESDKDKSLKKLVRNPLLTSRMLCLPSFNYLFELLSDNNTEGIDAEYLQDCIDSLQSQIGFDLYAQFVYCYNWSRDQLSLLSLYPNYTHTYEGWLKGRNYRSLLNIALAYMIKENEQKSFKQMKQSSQILFEQYQISRNMTEMFGSLHALCHSNRSDLNNEKCEILQHFYNHFSDDKLVIQKWLRLQAMTANDAQTINALLEHECYDSLNPNFIYSVMGAFAFANPKGFHHNSGEGYQFVTDQICYYDSKNASVASRLCKSFECANKLDKMRQNIIFGELEKVLRKEELSKGTYEVALKIANSIQS